MYPSSVVQTGVKSFGCEKRMAHPLPIQSWKLIFPWVVSAVELGASLLIRSPMVRLRSDSVVMELVAERHAGQNAPARRPGKVPFTGHRRRFNLLHTLSLLRHAMAGHPRAPTRSASAPSETSARARSGGGEQRRQAGESR